MRKFLVVLLSMSMLLSLYAIDITTRTGAQYNNAEIIKELPNGIVIQYVNSIGNQDVKLIPFTDLPDNFQNKTLLKDSSQKQQAQFQDVSSAFEENELLSLRKKEFKKREQLRQKVFDETMYKVMKDRKHLTFKSIENVDKNCMGWIKFTTEDSDKSTKADAKICLLNVNLDSGSVWSGHLVQIDNKSAFYKGERLVCYMSMNDAFNYYYQLGLRKNNL